MEAVLSWEVIQRHLGFPGGSDGKESACNEDVLEEEMAAHSRMGCLENPMDRGAWWATVYGVTELDMTEQLTLSLFYFK